VRLDCAAISLFNVVLGIAAQDLAAALVPHGLEPHRRLLPWLLFHVTMGARGAQPAHAGIRQAITPVVSSL
jgi:hypothetical protein